MELGSPQDVDNTGFQKDLAMHRKKLAHLNFSLDNRSGNLANLR
jgi:hypothetical protein